MPQMLRCNWEKTRPLLELVAFPAGESIPQKAALSAAMDPERDLLGSVVLTRDQAMQEVAIFILLSHLFRQPYQPSGE